MKLLQLNVTANWGSTGKIAEGIGLSAIERGWESAIAYGRYMNPSKSQLIKVGSQKDVYFHYAQNRLFDKEGLGSHRPTKRLIEWIKDYNPDIVHLHNIHDHWINYPILFEYLAKVDIPVVWTFHDCWAFTGGCTHFENSECYSWRDNKCMDNCPQQHSKAVVQYTIRRKCLGAVGDRLTVVCASKWLENYVRQSFLKDIGANVTTIHNGIDMNSAFRISSKKKRLILGVSNVWTKYKGLCDFIELRRILPSDVEIQLVGLTQKQIESLPNGISAIKRTDNIEQLASLYNNAAVFVNPTYNDTFPTVNLEALACGTPVVTYRTGGCPETINEKTGIVVEKGNKEALYESIMTVINNPEKFSSDDCRAYAEANFNRDIQFGKYIKLYNSLLK